MYCCPCGYNTIPGAVVARKTPDAVDVEVVVPAPQTCVQQRGRAGGREGGRERENVLCTEEIPGFDSELRAIMHRGPISHLYGAVLIVVVAVARPGLDAVLIHDDAVATGHRQPWPLELLNV